MHYFLTFAALLFFSCPSAQAESPAPQRTIAAPQAAQSVAPAQQARCPSGQAGMDIEATAQTVMADCARDSQGDLKDVLQDMHEQNRKKASMRSAIGQQRQAQQQEKQGLREVYDERTGLGQRGGAGQGITKTKHDTVKNSISNVRMARTKNDAILREIETKLNEIKNKMDSLDGMSEEQSMRLQMLQDRISKMMAALSNILKKNSETQSGIIQNMK